jgi:hypothetical protein
VGEIVCEQKLTGRRFDALPVSRLGKKKREMKSERKLPLWKYSVEVFGEVFGTHPILFLTLRAQRVIPLSCREPQEWLSKTVPTT